MLNIKLISKQSKLLKNKLALEGVRNCTSIDFPMAPFVIQAIFVLAVFMKSKNILERIRCKSVDNSYLYFYTIFVLLTAAKTELDSLIDTKEPV